MEAPCPRATIDRLLSKPAATKFAEINHPLRLGGEPSHRQIPPRVGIHSHIDAFPTLGGVRGVAHGGAAKHRPRLHERASRIKTRVCRKRNKLRTNRMPLMATPSKAVLITGCSTGIGAETARHLAAKGWNVYATARKPETLSDLESAGVKTLALDVTDEASMKAAVDAVAEAEGAVGVLINNAGYSQSGAVESIELDSIRRQFETNVFGLIRMSQLCLPGMRDQAWGRIVNIGSMGGKLTFPGGGIYHATKYSVEAISDAMRFEVKGFGVDVILIEPGLITTEFSETAVASLGGDTVEDGPYRKFNEHVGKMTADAYKGPLAKLGGGPDAVAGVIAKSIGSSRPRPRYPVTASARLAMGQRRLVTDRMWDRLMAAQYKRPRA